MPTKRKPLTDLQKAKMRAWYHANKDRHRLYQKRSHERHPDAWEATKLRQRLRPYGLTIEQYKRMVEDQRGLCGICGEPEKVMKHGRVQGLPVDHDHRTGVVRGLLCSECNSALGKFRDDVVLLEAAIRWLKKDTD